MGKGVERTQILRRDCPTCFGRGYVVKGVEQSECPTCTGLGMLEKEVDYKFETGGRWSKEEEAAAWGVEPEELKDTGHSVGD